MGSRGDGRQAEHDLCVHVAEVGSVHLTRDAQGAPSARLPHGYRGIATFDESEWPGPGVVQEPPSLRRGHRITTVDGWPEIEQASAPRRRRDRGRQTGARQQGATHDTRAQPLVFGRVFGYAARGEQRESERGDPVDHDTRS